MLLTFVRNITLLVFFILNFTALGLAKNQNYVEHEHVSIKLISSIESDPKVLIIDDYGSHLDHETLKDFNKKLSHVARARGVTIVLASSHPKEITSCLSVLLSLDNGHLSKVRSFKRQDQRKSKS